MRAGSGLATVRPGPPCAVQTNHSWTDWLIYRPHSVDGTREAVVGDGGVPGFNGPHGLAAGTREDQR